MESEKVVANREGAEYLYAVAFSPMYKYNTKSFYFTNNAINVDWKRILFYVRVDDDK